MKYTPKKLESNVNVTPTSPLRDFFVMAGGLMAIVIGTYLLLGVAVDLLAPRISPELEAKMAKYFLMAVKSEDNNNSEEILFVQDLLDHLQDSCGKLPYDFKVYLHESDAVNAMALPGGNIVVFSGFLEKVTSENELAFVLSHEMGHYANRDHLRGIGRSLVFLVISAVFLGPDSKVGNMLTHGLSITELSFSRKQETSADEFAIDTLACLYGHVNGSTDFFSKIDKEHDPGIFGHYFSTHPENKKRISHIKAFADQKGYVHRQRKDLPADYCK